MGPAAVRRLAPAASTSPSALSSADDQDRLAGERIYYDRATVLRQIGVMSEPTSVRGQIGALLLHLINVFCALVGIPRIR